MAGVTERIGFVPDVIILPQRQTALAAKQAATLDVLSTGRLRLGVGLGWNQVEYVALDQDFHNRGRRIEEQVTLLRELWTRPLVEFSGQWHTVPDAGLNPLPVQQPIPIWFGGRVDAALRRMARLGDGWLTLHLRPDEARPDLDKLERYLAEAGRSRTDFGVEARLPYSDGKPESWTRLIEAWQAAGATHLDLNTMGAGLASPAAHLEALHKFAQAAGLG